VIVVKASWASDCQFLNKESALWSWVRIYVICDRMDYAFSLLLQISALLCERGTK
jgi:hypothetical protein